VPATIQDVARRAGVSITTVSRVLNRSPHPVSAAVRARVETAASELDFRPSSLARGLAGRGTRTLALVVPDIANPYYPRLSRGVEDLASEHGYAVLVCNTDHQQAKLSLYLRLLREKRVDGVLLAGGGHEDPGDVEALAEAGLTVQAIGRHPLRVPSVRIDNLEAARAATTHLAARDRRRIAFVGGPALHTTVADRRAGYRAALEAAGLRPEPGLEVEVGFGPADGERAAAGLLARPNRPDAVVAFNDYLAIGLMHHLFRQGIDVPGEVAVVGFDDIPLAGYFRPSLTSVAVPAYELGAQATVRLLRQLAGEPVEAVVWLPTQIAERESSG
jgi:LacI family transcriptional regulator